MNPEQLHYRSGVNRGNLGGTLGGTLEGSVPARPP